MIERVAFWSVAQERLHAAALLEASITADDSRARDPMAMSISHVNAHSVPTVLWIDGKPMQLERCTLKPCRLGALCFALFEVSTYLEEVSDDDPVIEFAAEIERIGALLDKSSESYGRAHARLDEYLRQSRLESSRLRYAFGRTARLAPTRI